MYIKKAAAAALVLVLLLLVYLIHVQKERGREVSAKSLNGIDKTFRQVGISLYGLGNHKTLMVDGPSIGWIKDCGYSQGLSGTREEGGGSANEGLLLLVYLY